jgi:hypothetical protein
MRVHPPAAYVARQMRWRIPLLALTALAPAEAVA